MASGKPHIRFFLLLLFDAINCTPTSRHPKRMRFVYVSKSAFHSFTPIQLSNKQCQNETLTSSHLVLQRGRTILHQLLQWQCSIGQFQIQQTLHLFGMMELQHTLISVVLCANVVQKNVDDFQKKFFRLWICSHICWKNICKISILILSARVRYVHFFYRFRKSNKWSLIKEIKKKMFAKNTMRTKVYADCRIEANVMSVIEW